MARFEEHHGIRIGFDRSRAAEAACRRQLGDGAQRRGVGDVVDGDARRARKLGASDTRGIYSRRRS
jgi:hypothetical protein